MVCTGSTSHCMTTRAETSLRHLLLPAGKATQDHVHSQKLLNDAVHWLLLPLGRRNCLPPAAVAAALQFLGASYPGVVLLIMSLSVTSLSATVSQKLWTKQHEHCAAFNSATTLPESGCAIQCKFSCPMPADQSSLLCVMSWICPRQHKLEPDTATCVEQHQQDAHITLIHAQPYVSPMLQAPRCLSAPWSTEPAPACLWCWGQPAPLPACTILG